MSTDVRSDQKKVLRVHAGGRKWVILTATPFLFERLTSDEQFEELIRKIVSNALGLPDGSTFMWSIVDNPDFDANKLAVEPVEINLGELPVELLITSDDGP